MNSRPINNTDFLYHQVSQDEEEALEDTAFDFCAQHGDGDTPLISEEDFFQLYDLLGEGISKYASFGDDDPDADFMGSRLVEKIPFITLVAEDDADPAIALKAALETIKNAHRPLAISFDYHPHALLVLPPNIVYSTFSIETLSGNLQ